jgi:DNA-binding transcriptional LysR family regulator
VIRFPNKAETVELRQIRSFLSIAETLHFGRTAELIHISQPALSLQIRALEEEFGVRLFERNRRKTTLTVAGEAFRDDAVAALSQLDQAIRKARLAAIGKRDCCGSASSLAWQHRLCRTSPVNLKT